MKTTFLIITILLTLILFGSPKSYAVIDTTKIGSESKILEEKFIDFHEQVKDYVKARYELEKSKVMLDENMITEENYLKERLKLISLEYKLDAITPDGIQIAIRDSQKIEDRVLDLQSKNLISSPEANDELMWVYQLMISLNINIEENKIKLRSIIESKFNRLNILKKKAVISNDEYKSKIRELEVITETYGLD